MEPCILILAPSVTSGKPFPLSVSTPHPLSSMKVVLGQAKDPCNLIFYIGSKSKRV